MVERDPEVANKDRFLTDITDYSSPSSRVKGFQEIAKMGFQAPKPMLILTHGAFKEYREQGLTASLQASIVKAFGAIRTENPKRGAYIGRAFYVPEIDNPNGPRTASIRDENEYLEEVERFWQFALENGYDQEGADIALILHPFIHVMDPPRTRYGEMELSEGEILPHSAGYAFTAPLPGRPHRVEIRASFGTDEAVQSCPHDVIFVDPEVETVLEKRIAYKDKTFIPQTGSSYVMTELPSRFRSFQSLTDWEALLIAKQMMGLKNTRVEFAVQEDGIFFREIAPYDPLEERRFSNFKPGEEVVGPVITVSLSDDLEKLKGSEPIVYLGPEAFRERRTDLFSQVANARRERITALVHGTLQTSHMARILADQGHNIVLVGEDRFQEGEWVTIKPGDNGLPEVERVNTYAQAILNLDDVQRLRRGEAGRKLARLAMMHAAGIRVPAGFAIRSEALWQHLKDNNLYSIVQEADSLDIGDRGDLEELARGIQKQILESKLNSDFEYQLDQAISGWSFPLFVVRSSGDEDGENHSMAGLFESHINVSPSLVKEKILATMASYFSPAAITALRSIGKKPSQISLGVGVQEFISEPTDSEQSGGTIFTYPDRMVVEAVYGHPELIVSAEAKDFVRITTDREGNLLEREVFGKENNCPEVKSGFGEILEQLIPLAHQIETIFTSYQDIEWIYNQKHGLVILQARPM